MSYNVDSWKVKKLNNLVIPLSAFYKHERKDWHPDRTNNDDGTVTLSCMDNTIKGELDEFFKGEPLFTVTEMSIYGEGSGTFLHDIVEPALKESQGELEVVRVWEGGDSIDRWKVKDGVVTSEAIDL